MIERVVFDTNVLISSTLWDNSVSQKLLFRCINNNIQIFSSQDIIEEYKRVLERDFNYDKKEIEEIYKKVIQFLILIIPSKKINIVKEDSEDNKIIECAIESKAGYIISYDKHILNLKEYEGTKIIKPEEALNILQ